MAAPWIKLSTHPDDAKILRVASLTQTDPDRVFRCVIRWFFWIDANYKGHQLSVTGPDLHDLTRWTSRKPLAAAMSDAAVDWLIANTDGSYSPTRPDSHFARSSKTRSLAELRVRDHRQRGPDVPRVDSCNAQALQNLTQRREREEEKKVFSQVSICTEIPDTTETPTTQPDEFQTLEAFAKRPLNTGERAAIAREAAAVEQRSPIVIHGVSVAAADVWRRCLGQLGREPGFVFTTGVQALRYVGAMLARCEDQGCWPDERMQANGVRDGPTDAEIREHVRKGIERADRKRK